MTETLTVARSLARRVFIDDKPMNLIAEDFPTEALCDAAASMACVAITRGNIPLPKNDQEWDFLGDCIARALHIDTTRPFGCCLFVEPIAAG